VTVRVAEGADRLHRDAPSDQDPEGEAPAPRDPGQRRRQDPRQRREHVGEIAGPVAIAGAPIALGEEQGLGHHAGGEQRVKETVVDAVRALPARQAEQAEQAEQQPWREDQEALARAQQLARETREQRVRQVLAGSLESCVERLAADQVARRREVAPQDQRRHGGGTGQECHLLAAPASTEQAGHGNRQRQQHVRKACGGEQHGPGAGQPQGAQRRRRGSREEQRHEHQLRDPVLPERLARDDPGRGAEGAGDRQGERVAHLEPPAQEQVETSHRQRGERRSGDLLEQRREESELGGVPARRVEIEIGRDVEGQRGQGGDHRRTGDHPTLDHVGRDLRRHPRLHFIGEPFEGQPVVTEDRERQVTSRAGVGGRDHPGVRRVDGEAQDHDQRRPQPLRHLLRQVVSQGKSRRHRRRTERQRLHAPRECERRLKRE
jgi:hypothetical protein